MKHPAAVSAIPTQHGLIFQQLVAFESAILERIQSSQVLWPRNPRLDEVERWNWKYSFTDSSNSLIIESGHKVSFHMFWHLNSMGEHLLMLFTNTSRERFYCCKYLNHRPILFFLKLSIQSIKIHLKLDNPPSKPLTFSCCFYIVCSDKMFVFIIFCFVLFSVASGAIKFLPCW